MVNSQFDMNRRTLLQRALILIGAAGVATHSGIAVAVGKPGDAQHSTLLKAVADTLLPRTETPGAIDVGVPALFEALLLNWASPARREQLIQALSAIDETARSQTGRAFVALPSASQLDVLTIHDAAALAIADSADISKDRFTGVPKSNSAGSLLTATHAVDPGYAKLKELLVTLYYFSEPALTSELTYDPVPGSWESSVPLTAAAHKTGGPIIP